MHHGICLTCGGTGVKGEIGGRKRMCEACEGRGRLLPRRNEDRVFFPSNMQQDVFDRMHGALAGNMIEFRKERCPRCEGDPYGRLGCHVCGETGVVIISRDKDTRRESSGVGHPLDTQHRVYYNVACPECNGRVPSVYYCNRCNKTGTIVQEATINTDGTASPNPWYPPSGTTVEPRLDVPVRIPNAWETGSPWESKEEPWKQPEHSVTRVAMCPICEGKGVVIDSTETYRCSVCDGHGQLNADDADKFREVLVLLGLKELKERQEKNKIELPKDHKKKASPRKKAVPRKKPKKQDTPTNHKKKPETLKELMSERKKNSDW